MRSALRSCQMANKQQKQSQAYDKAIKLIESANKEIYLYSNGRIPNIPSEDKIGKALYEECERIVREEAPVVPPGYEQYDPTPPAPAAAPPSSAELPPTPADAPSVRAPETEGASQTAGPASAATVPESATASAPANAPCEPDAVPEPTVGLKRKLDSETAEERTD